MRIPIDLSMVTQPRLLFITNEPPHTAAAGSIYFHRLFADYPVERLRVITNNPPPVAASLLDCDYHGIRLPLDRLRQTRFWRWRTAARVLGATALASLRDLDKLIDGFEADAVVTLMQDSWMYELAARYAKKTNLPLILFIHDLPHGFEPVASCLAKRQLRRDREIYAQAAVRFCVSPGMEAWFRKEFGLSGKVLLPPRSSNPPSQDPELCRLLKNPGKLTLGYAGGLHYGYGEQIAAMLPVLRATQTRLEIFGPTPTESLASLNEANDVLTFHGYTATPEEAWSGLLARCDAVLLPYLNPPGPHHLQYQTHFPSKLGDMLSLGLPLLVTGPPDASGLAWCREHGELAIAVTDTSPGAIATILVALREDDNLRVRLARAAQASVADAFSPEPLKMRMMDSIGSNLNASAKASQPAKK
jgi:glycosyltransferase involved in cell wall biosynthesis